MNNVAPRETALKILYDIDVNQAYANISLKKHLNVADHKTIDRGLITELVYGSLKYKLTIDYIIKQFSNIKINKISKWILNILRIGVYQIVFLDKIPDSAACNESVNLAKKYGHQASVKFVNGILRNIARNKEDIKYPDKKHYPIEYLMIKHSYPEWLVKRWIGRFGFDFTEDLCMAGNQTPDLCIRANLLKISSKELIDILSQEGVKAVQGKYCSEALMLDGAGSIDSLEAFKQGLFQVQDESSMMVSKVLDPRPGEFVIDVCCAPGGKITHIAELMQNMGQVFGWDIHEHKLKLVQAAAKRLGLSIIKTETHDATIVMDELYGKADRVLVDAPCSGLGIIRRKPDIKWNKENEDLNAITALQDKILQTSSKYVKKGGCLVYSTCTIEDNENIDVVNRFLKSHPEFVMEDIKDYFSRAINKKTMEHGYIQLFPNVDRTDGFFICRMKRKE